MTAWTLSLLSVALVSLVALVGLATLSMNPVRLRKLATLMISFAVGALLGDAFIHLIPETFADRPSGDLEGSLLILGGIVLFFILEKLLRRGHSVVHHHHQHHPTEVRRPELAAINLIGDGVHNFIDGALIAGSYLISPTLGVSTTIAVLFHEVPQELGDFGVLIHSGVPVRRAVLLNLASASCAILGALVTLSFGSAFGGWVESTLIPVTAGGFVYIAAADLIPELQHERSWKGFVWQSALMTLGIGVMAALRFFD